MDKQESKKDEALLKRFGYAQELFRTLSGFSNFAISFSVISILTGSIALYGYGLTTAGPRGIILGWIIVSFASIPIVFSMAELASAFPTAGALYHWATFLGNRHVGWFTACFNYLGQFAITAGIDYGLAEFLVALLIKDANPSVKYSLYAGILFTHAIINHFGIRWVDFFNQLSAWYHLAGVAVLIAVILIFAPLQPMAFLLEPSTTSSYSYGYAFCLGLLQAQWTISGYDASAHVSEETLNVSKKVPVGMITSVVSSALLGLIMLIAITLSVGDLSNAQRAGNPFIYIMQAALGTQLGSAMVWLCLIAMWFCGLSSLTSNSRMLYAFARDKAIPLHGVLSRISKAHRTPASAIWLSAILAFGIALYGQIYNVVVAMATILIFISYLIPIFTALVAQLSGQWHENQKGEFRLGKWSKPCSALASMWIVFIVVVFVMPPNELAGYATVGLTVSLIFAYFLYVKRKYHSALYHVPSK